MPIAEETGSQKYMYKPSQASDTLPTRSYTEEHVGRRGKGGWRSSLPHKVLGECSDMTGATPSGRGLRPTGIPCLTG